MNQWNLIINAGSSTYKYTLFEKCEKKLSVLYEKRGEKIFLRKVDSGRGDKITQQAFENSLKDLLSLSAYQNLIWDKELQAIGFRYVHGGHVFRKATRVKKSLLRKLKALDHLAPLHNPSARRLVEQSEKILPSVRKVLFFDTAFHSTIPEKNWRYALPKKITEKHHIRRYGFHGLVCSSIVQQLQKKWRSPKKVILCHLGSGCSVTAIEKGKSIETSMGFTPLEGLIMMTRAGDIDPGILLHLQNNLRIPPKNIEEMLNNESGIKALAGTRDMREVLRKNDEKSKLAVDMFCLKAAQEISKAIISLGGLNQLVFSGGIGENAPLVRKKICDYLKPLGIRIHEKKNQRAKEGSSFHKRFSVAKVSWMKADEAGEINRQLSFFF